MLIENRDRIIQATFILIPLSLLTKGLLVGRDLVGAYYFGATAELDAFLVADSIFRFLSSTLLVGSFSMVFVPVLVDYLGRDDKHEAWILISSLTNISALLLGVASMAAALFAPSIIAFIAPGMRPAYQELAVALTRLMAATVLLVGLAEILRSVLYAQRSYLSPMVAVCLATLTAMVVIIVYAPTIGIYSLAIGAVAAAVLRIVIQLLAERGKGTQYHLVFRWQHPAMLRMAGLFAGMSVVMGLNQLNVVVTRYFASWLESGSIAVYNYASLAESFLVDILALSVVTPLFPELSVQAARDDLTQFRRTFFLALRMIALVLFPVIGLSVVFRTPAIALILQRGMFTVQDTERVAAVYPFLAVAILVWGCGRIISFAFYALQEVRPLIVVTVLGVGLNIIFDWLLIGPMGIAGLAVAASVGAVGGAALATWLLGRIVGWEGAGASIKPLLKIVLVSGIMLLVTWALFTFSKHLPNSDGTWFLWGRIVVSSSVALTLYFMLLQRWGVDEFQIALKVMVDRTKKLLRVSKHQYTN